MVVETILVGFSSEVKIINGLWSCRAAARTVRWGRRARVVEGSESGLKRKGRYVKYRWRVISLGTRQFEQKAK